MTALFGLALWSLLRDQLLHRTWLLRALLYAIPLPWVAIEAGWFVAEFGRQPWTITHVLPTAASVSNLTVGQLTFSLVSIFLIYSTLLVIEMGLMRHFIRKGPASLHTGRYHNETAH